MSQPTTVSQCNEAAAEYQREAAVWWRSLHAAWPPEGEAEKALAIALQTQQPPAPDRAEGL